MNATHEKQTAQSMALRYGQNRQVQNEQCDTHTNKTKIGHKKSKQQKMSRTTQKVNRTAQKMNRTVQKLNRTVTKINRTAHK